MTELHESFDDWLLAGARDALPRDVALHASACPDCLRTAAAFDALGAVDLGGAPEPPPWATGSRLWTPRAVLVARTSVGLAAAALIVAAGFVTAGGLLDVGGGELTGATSSTPQGEGVLGNAGGPRSASAGPATATASASPASEAPSATAQPSRSAQLVPQDNPPMGGGPPPISTLRPTPTPRPVVTTPVPSAAIPTPAPTALPSTTPPTPTPTPSPTTAASGSEPAP